LRDGRARVCVATDVAARGLDLPDLGLVIHADVPQNGQMLVHRSGRTGRAGKHGLAILLVPERARRYVERLVASAHVDVSWRPAPSMHDIHLRDQEQLVGEIGALADGSSQDDRRVARTLLSTRQAEDLVAALVRLRREARPAPEELTPVAASRRSSSPRLSSSSRPSSSSKSSARQPRAEAKRDGYTWFTINVGRSKNADPKWLIPLLCRRGNITKRAIGKIKILARDTRVEIANDAAEGFAQALLRPDDKDRNVHIERCEAP